MIPRVLRNFHCFVNGIGYAGRVTEVELPELSVKTEEHRGGGMDGPAELDMGLEVMTAKLTFAEYEKNIMGLWGKLDGNAARIQIRGAIQRDGETAIPCIVEFHGGFKKNTMGTWKAGDLATNEFEATLRYYKLTMGEDVIYEIDIDNMKRIINGVDELASIRAAMGM